MSLIYVSRTWLFGTFIKWRCNDAAFANDNGVAFGRTRQETLASRHPDRPYAPLLQ